MSDREQRTVIAEETSAPPRRPGRDPTIVPGDVLNGIYRVERFIARGGMGEVFEGVNIESDERVAIKAIRSHLASDPKVIALFRKEARVLTQFAHPAIVGYRVFARDPVLDLHYIVADFINGEPLGAHLNGVRPSIRDVVTLARRLAAGLEAAHDHGAIHRDMSPDNVLLPDGRIDRAKIIDFGIAKSLDLSVETMVGDGFAGKLGYVAPEQFGDYGRQVGPWTDVYSTALVMLAFARGVAPAMGTTLSEAVERRRTGPDLADVPVELAPLIERMTVPDPAARIRSMREVMLGLENIRLPPEPAIGVSEPAGDLSPKPRPRGGPVAQSGVTTFAPAASSPPPPAPQVDAGKAPASGPPASPMPSPRVRRRQRWALLGVPIVAAAAIAAAIALDRPSSSPAVQASSAPTRVVPAPASLPVADRAARYQQLLAPLPCSWIDARSTTEDAPVALRGASADTGAVRARIAGGTGALGAANASEVRAVNIAQCGVIDALRPFHRPTTSSDAPPPLITASVASAGEGAPGCLDARGQTVELTAIARDPVRELALIALQPDGRLLQIAGGREEFERLATRDPARFNIGPDGSYHATLCYSQPGLAAIAILDSRRMLDLGLTTGEATLPPADFAERLSRQGQAEDLQVVVDWAAIEPGGAPRALPTPLVAAAAAPVPQTRPPVEPASRPQLLRPSRERTRAEAALETAAANRRELDRIRGVAPARPGATSSCRRFEGGWRDVGAVGRNACIATAMKGRCGVSYAMFQDRLFRRANGHIQEQRGSRWRNVVADPGC
jgi:serine/threonine-protein kinase